MAQPHPDKDYMPIPINTGNFPDWQVRLGFSQLLNMFVGESGYIYVTPGLSKVNADVSDNGARAVWESFYGTGAYFTITDTAIIKIGKDGSYKVLQSIRNSGKSVQIGENIQNQIGIVDGKNFWVIEQRANDNITLMGEDQGFSFKSPISIVVINTFCVVLDEETNTWTVSDPNNMLSFPALDSVPQIGDQLKKSVSLQTLSDNLYIFGTQGIERWVPSISNNPYLFPFTKDVNFRKDFGAIGTNSVVRGFNEIYFLSSKYVPMALSADGSLRDIGPDKCTEGIARIISDYQDINFASGSFYTYKSNYFYSLTFPVTGKNWTYCQNSNTWSFNDDNIIASVQSGEVVATKNGLFSLSLIPNYKRRRWRSMRITDDKGSTPFRMSLNAAKARIVQGILQQREPQYLELSISKDSENFGNVVRRPMALTGQRQNETTWKMNMTGHEFTFLLSYDGNLDLTIESFSALIR